MAEKEIIERWRIKSEIDYRCNPPLDYKTYFYQAVQELRSRRKFLLDLGTGTGKAIFETKAYKMYAKAIGIDSERGMIELARARTRQSGIPIEFLQGDNLNLPFYDETFHIVTSMFSPYAPEEVARVLARGGYFILLWGLYGDHREITASFPKIFKLWDNKLYFETFAEREERLNKAGLKIIGHNTLQYQWLFQNLESLKNFYEKIFLAKIFEGKEERLSSLSYNSQGEIPITRIIGTTIAQKITT